MTARRYVRCSWTRDGSSCAAHIDASVADRTILGLAGMVAKLQADMLDLGRARGIRVDELTWRAVNHTRGGVL